MLKWLSEDSSIFWISNSRDSFFSSFENMISFEPDAPPSPHSEEDHKYIETFNDKLQELMMREEE